MCTALNPPHVSLPWLRLWCGPRLSALYLQSSNRSMNVKTEQSPLTAVCRPHSISQYLCEQKTRLNFLLESPRMRADVTGGYSPPPLLLLLLWPYRCTPQIWRRRAPVRERSGFALDFTSSQQWEFADKQRKVHLAWNAASSESRSVFSRLEFL